jgi:hypothetical protein
MLVAFLSAAIPGAQALLSVRCIFSQIELISDLMYSVPTPHTTGILSDLTLLLMMEQALSDHLP